MPFWRRKKTPLWDPGNPPRLSTVVNDNDGATYGIVTILSPPTKVWETIIGADRADAHEPERLANVYIVTRQQIRSDPKRAQDRTVVVLEADDRTVTALHNAVTLMAQKRPRREFQSFIVVDTYIALTELGLTPFTMDDLRKRFPGMVPP